MEVISIERSTYEELLTSFNASQRACHLVMHMLAAAEHLGCELRRL